MNFRWLHLISSCIVCNYSICKILVIAWIFHSFSFLKVCLHIMLRIKQLDHPRFFPVIHGARNHYLDTELSVIFFCYPMSRNLKNKTHQEICTNQRNPIKYWQNVREKIKKLYTYFVLLFASSIRIYTPMPITHCKCCWQFLSRIENKKNEDTAKFNRFPCPYNQHTGLHMGPSLKLFVISNLLHKPKAKEKRYQSGTYLTDVAQ